MPPTLLQFLFIDGNARVGSVEAPCFGQASPDWETHNGSLLRETLTSVGLVAVNTFSCPGYTWRAPNMSTARIDYIGSPAPPTVQCVRTYVENGVDLSLGAREDHRVIAATFRLANTSPRPKARTDKLRFNKSCLSDHTCIYNFQGFLMRFRCSDDISIDTHAVQLNDYVGKAAIKAFGSAQDQPIKPWLSMSTWQVVKWIVPFRRVYYRAFRLTKRYTVQMVFLFWASHISVAYTPGSVVPFLGWGAKARLSCLYGTVSFVWSVNAACWRTCQLLQKLAKPMVTYDRHCFLQSMAADVQRAAYQGKTRECFSIVRKLAGNGGVPHARSMKMLDGDLTKCESERQQRWQEHFAHVFQGEVVKYDDIPRATASDATLDSFVDTSPAVVVKAFAKLASDKGVGPRRDVPAELLKAGGTATAALYSRLYGRIVHDETWPITWTGGRIQDIYKHKGDPTLCDSSTGILLASHAYKGLSNIIAAEVEPHYNSNMPECQNGAVAGRGRDFAAHVIRTVMDLASMSSLSIFILFVDLVKAYDRIVREIVLGFPDGVNDLWST